MKNLKKLFIPVCIFLTITTKAQNGNFPSNVNQNEVYCLSMLSNIPAQTYGATFIIDKPWTWKDSASKSAQKIINYSVPIIDSCLKNAVDSISNPSTKLSLSKWTRFWGPGVIAMESGILPLLNKPDYYVSAASMTIFQNISTNTFVVAIQATNPNSMYAWNTLDFSVGQTIPWNKSDTSQGVISNGTSIGLGLLKNLTDINADSAIAKLIGSCTSQTNVVVTGHSLGGALSPVLALYLKNNYQSKFNNVYCLSTAGATPGNYSFAKYYNSQMQNNTIRIWNHFDIIPHAWNITIMDSIKSNNNNTNGNNLYGGIYSLPGTSVFYDSSYTYCNPNKKQPSPFSSMNTPDYINVLVESATNKTAGINYTPICNNGATFYGPSVSQGANNFYLDIAHDTTGNYLMSFLYFMQTGKVIKVVDSAFLPQMAAQHVDGYTYMFQMKQIHEYIRSRIEANPLSLINDCSKTSSFKQGFINLSNNKNATKNKQNHYAILRALIYKKAWRL